MTVMTCGWAYDFVNSETLLYRPEDESPFVRLPNILKEDTITLYISAYNRGYDEGFEGGKRKRSEEIRRLLEFPA